MSDGSSTATPRAGWPVLTKHAVELACLLAAVTIWITSLPAIDPEKLNDFGLIAVLPPGMWIAYALLVLTFASVMLDEKPNGLGAALSLSALIAMLHATPSLVYGTLRYSWAWKHLGIVDYIQRHHALDPSADFLAAYHNWPALFIATAETGSRLGLNSSDLARIVNYTPLVLNLAFLAILPQLFSRLTGDVRTVWFATALFIVGNWVGQDYFSPQGASFLMYLIAVTLCLGPLRKPVSAPARGHALLFNLGRFQAWATTGMPPPGDTPAGMRVAATLLLLVLILLIVATHQLTPVLLIATLFGLAALNLISPTFFFFAVAAEIAWLFYFASPFTASILPELLAEFGNTAGSALTKMANLGEARPGQIWVSTAARSLTGVIALAAVLGGLLRMREGKRDGAAAWLVLAPVPLIVATSYGGEILFRAYFYALPGLCFFAAALFGTKRIWVWTRVSTIVFAAFLALLVPAFVMANNGKDRQYRFTQAEVDLATWLYQNAPPGSLLIEGSRSYPSQFINYENFAYLPISEESRDVQEEIIADPARVLGHWLDQSPHGGFVILTKSQQASVEDIGIMPTGSFDKLVDGLLSSPMFVVVMSNADGVILTLHENYKDLLGSQQPFPQN